jgi:hypothetical protein
MSTIIAPERLFARLGQVPKVAQAAKGAGELGIEAQRGIRSLEKQIAAHEEKLKEFLTNPTVRPGMENLPKELIQQQQLRRIQKLENEIQTFKDNIRKILNGDL